MTTITPIFVQISAADSIRHSCQCGWQRIDAELSEWTPEERELLACKIRDDKGARLEASVAPPDSETLRAWVAARLAQAAEEREDKLAEAAADIEAVKAKLAEFAALPTERLNLEHQVLTVTGYSCSRADAALSVLGVVSRNGYVCPQDFGRGEDFAAKCAADAARKVALEAEEQAAKAAHEDREHSNLKAILTNVPDGLRARYEAGFASMDEVQNAYRAILLAEFELDEDTTAHEDAITSLSDEEFEALCAARKRFADMPNIEVEPFFIWDWEKATECDDADTNCHGEVKRGNRVIQVMIKRHGVTALGIIPMPKW